MRKLYIRLVVFSPHPSRGEKYPNPLPSFLALLRALASLNPSKLEEITLRLHVEYYPDSAIDMSVWREISNVLIDKGCFPYFRKFNVSINADEETYDLFNLYASNIHDWNVDIKVDSGGGKGFSELKIYLLFLLIMIRSIKPIAPLLARFCSKSLGYFSFSVEATLASFYLIFHGCFPCVINDRSYHLIEFQDLYLIPESTLFISQNRAK